MMLQKNNTLLALDKVSLAFGGLQAVEQVSFGVARGTVKAIIGPKKGETVEVSTPRGSLKFKIMEIRAA